MTVLLGLLAAVCYGTSDFVGGVTSRRVSALSVLTYSYPVGAVLMLCFVPLVPGDFTARAFVFGLLGGAAGIAGVVTMYRLMVDAPMNVISPVSALLAAIVPVVVGVVTGDRPAALTWFGIVLGLGAVLLVSRTSDENPHGRIGLRVLALAAFSGLGFGLYFVFLARAGDSTGLWPLVVSRFGSAALLLPVIFAKRTWVGVSGRLLPLVAFGGACDALANMFFPLASRHGLLSLAAVLTSLHPAVTVLLAVGVLQEHTARIQRVGLGVAAVAIVLITV